jgi:hypothetical protein
VIWAACCRRRIGAFWVLVVSVAMVLANCGGGGTAADTSDPSYVKSATVWESQLRAANLGCTDVRPNQSLGKKPKETVSCMVGKENVSFFRWKDHSQTMSIVNTTKGQACSFAKQYGVKIVVVVAGDNWTANPQSARTGQKIALATHGTSATISC